MAFVVDASAIAAWVLPDESNPVADLVAARLTSESASAPGIWWFEIRNILVMAERRGRIVPNDTVEALALLTELEVEQPSDVDEALLLGLARAHRLSLYDAAYLELAVRTKLPLATTDRALIKAALAEGVPLIGLDG
ncbi:MULTISPECIES: type II toxin-antitoxin system VapC family toxin [Methylobacterium]|uniref:Ribonuclease VapC n=1 Tax=Methylobacterium thuringiense TaxID=1003091 RepID=A0ABQ4TP95_9HYPH|nr:MULTISPECIES: type II toxin-antitoxin system VapC family toxin [Methylobacterium]TXN23705.1 type II toxin-antitoxin system VapC family toxin [Methylobacterium sp. WL9]GJE56149.1 tRNA(fMet)-specific endonuclease VapC [Methylobacterium thuringiense]